MNEEIWREFDNLAAIVHRQALRIEELERRVEILLRQPDADVIDFPMSAAAEDRLAVDPRA